MACATRTTLTCAAPGCDTVDAPEAFPTTDYCSHRCEARHDGRNLLDRAIVHDHRRCGFCARKLKTVYRPERGVGIGRASKRWKLTTPPDNFIGYQSRTPEAAFGEKERSDEAYRRLVGTGTICGGCGTTAPNDPRPWAEHPNLEAVALRVSEAIRDIEPDAEVDEWALAEMVSETGDLPLAVGRCVEV